MDLRKEKFLNLRTTPARLNAEETSWYLGFAPHDIPVLISKGLLKPLGHPRSNSVKFFALTTLQDLRQDPKWLARASEMIAAHWRDKNQKRKLETEAFSNTETTAPNHATFA